MLLSALAVVALAPRPVVDKVDLSSPAEVRLGGLLGERYYGSVYNRLMKVDEEELLAGFRQKPGVQAWVGEHVGKWLHAASLSYTGTKDPKLMEKLKRVAKGLMDAQEPDGYLGTYVKGQRFGMYPNAEWDVWSHKYCIIGLLAYHKVTHDPRALEASRKAADLMIRTFPAGGKTIVEAGTHKGMASTSVIEPIVQLYEVTKDPKYLQFAQRVVASYKHPKGPSVIQDLMRTGSVAKTANGKAYEMLSNLVGLCEMYRVTGDPYYLKPTKVAWNDIVAKRLYVTGTGSAHEHWTPDGQLLGGEGDNVGETCVTVTWMQLNLQLLRLTGESKYADQLEKTVYNHLFGSQKPDGTEWCYYLPLEGRKHPSGWTSCCLSSGPRGVAMMPAFAYTERKDGVDVNLYGPSVLTLPYLRLRQVGDYPFTSTCRLLVEASKTQPWTMRLRIPAWVAGPKLTLNGRPLVAPKAGTYVSIQRVWQAGDRVDLVLPMPPKLVKGTGSDYGRVALQTGPLVYAMDSKLNVGARPMKYIGLASTDPKSFVRTDLPKNLDRVHITAKGFVLDMRTTAKKPLKLVFAPYYVAGRSGTPYTVWTLLPNAKLAVRPNPSFMGFGDTDQSRVGNQNGSFVDSDPKTRSVTYNFKKEDQDWYAVSLDKPVTISRVVYMHGAIYHDGGWFDTTSGKPRIQVRKTANGPWVDVATLDTYPETNATQMPALVDGQAFEVRFAPVKVYGLRVIGKPSCGDDPKQAFSSCAELQAFAK